MSVMMTCPANGHVCQCTKVQHECEYIAEQRLTCTNNAPILSFAGSKSSVDHPAHYGGKDNQYEAIKVIEAWKLGFNLGNAVKYISRYRAKENPIEDLKKARWYLDREISNLEKIG